MFDTLTERLSGSLRHIAGTGTADRRQHQRYSKRVRMALLEADVALPVARNFVARVKEQALGQEYSKNSPQGKRLLKSFMMNSLR